VIRIRLPRQPDIRLTDIGYRRTRWGSRKRRRFRSPMEYDARIGRRIDNQVGGPFGLTCFADGLARVLAAVGLTQVCRESRERADYDYRLMQSNDMR